MPLNRKDLLEEKEKRPVDKGKDDKALTEGGALSTMLETYGWKLLYEGFIKPNIDEVKFLEASREDLDDIRAEIRVLKRMLKFIDTRVIEASKVAEKIKQ